MEEGRSRKCWLRSRQFRGMESSADKIHSRPLVGDQNALLGGGGGGWIVVCGKVLARRPCTESLRKTALSTGLKHRLQLLIGKGATPEPRS